MERFPDGAKSIRLGHTEVKTTKPGRFKPRVKRRMKRKNSLKPVISGPDDEVPPSDAAPQSLQTSGSGLISSITVEEECVFCPCRRVEINRLLEENENLKRQLSQKIIDNDFLKDDDMKVRYYTGFPTYALLMELLAELQPSMHQTHQQLSSFQILALTLMHLKCGFPIQLIGELFSVDRNTAGLVFRETISIMFEQLKALVEWPERLCLQTTLSSRIVIIVDSLKLDIVRVGNIRGVMHLFPDDTKKCRVKYLMCFTPRGAVSFVSKFWDAHVSDQDVIEKSGLLDKMDPGDFVLADGGFDIRGDVGVVCAEVKASESGTTDIHKRLFVSGMEESRRFKNLRSQVIKVTGSLCEKYSVLNGPISASLIVSCDEDVTFLDRLVTVCAALFNMCSNVMTKP